MKPCRIVIIGGGSKGWTPKIVKDMLLTPELVGARFVLYDIDLPAAELMAGVLRKVAERLATPIDVTATDQRRAAFEDADYFIITIAVGGLDAMEHDIALAEQYGIYATVGDTAGPPGWSRLIRNFDTFVGFARDFNELAPQALVLNYTNPMTTLTDVLSRLCPGRVVGLCHGLFEDLKFIKQLYHLHSEDQIAAKYAGINHFFWVTEAKAGPIDVIADLRRRLEKESMTELFEQAKMGEGKTKPYRELMTELFRLTGVLPYSGDRHICEFLPWTINDPKRMEELKLVRTSVAERGAGKASLETRLKAMLAGDIGEDYLKRSRETAADIVAAHWSDKPFIDVGNLPNTGQISNLPSNLVVETAMRVDRNGFAPLTFGALPPVVHGLIQPFGLAFPMVVDACFRKDRKLALQALRLDPSCSRLSTGQVNELGEKLLTVHKQFITAF